MRIRTRVAAGTLPLVLLAACGQGTPERALPAQLAGAAQPLQHGSLTANDVSAAARHFGLDLMRRVCTPEGVGTLLSPASAFNALGMLDAASGDATAKAVSGMLHLPAWSPSVVAAIHDQQQALAPLSKGSGDTLRTSDRVWPDVSVTPTKRFLDDVRTAYGATLHTLDFGHPDAATKAINQQVSQDTDGLIPSLFDQSLDPSTTAVLTDAVVLKAKWKAPFLADPAPAPFTTPSGTRQVTQMRSTFFNGYSAAEGWQAAHIPYTSGTLEAVLLLPPEAKACALPSAAAFETLTTSESGAANVTMPKLHLEQTHELIKTLTSMGLPRTGDYSGLGSTDITDVVQKDVMTVDELGTTAAAATGIAMGSSAEVEPVNVHNLVFDRPYLLLLQDTSTHTPLFLASINDPTASQ